MRKWHRLSGVVLGGFLILHLGNHIALFWGPEAHMRLQDQLRVLYRHPLIEPVILAAAVTQIVTGLNILWRRGWPKLPWQKVQSVSGLLVAAFMMQHIGAALATRAFKTTIVTDIYWAASVVSRPAFALYFAPYYTIGVAALIVHIAALVALQGRRPQLARTLAILGAIFATLLVATLAGAFFDINLPAANNAYLDSFWSLTAP